MLSLDRQRMLLQLLRTHGSGNVLDLADTLGVSASTVRRDLKDMDERGLVTRVHGGASMPDADVEATLSSRSDEHAEQKRRIGLAAAQRVPDNATVLITGGTTTEAMLPHLAERTGLTVLTNGLNIAVQLARYEDVSVVVLGGVLRHDELSLLGVLAQHALAEFHVDLAFTGAFGIDADAGLSATNVTEAGTDRRILQSARQITVLADASKFGRRGPVRVADVDQISCVVTDADAPADALRRFRSFGVDVVTC